MITLLTPTRYRPAFFKFVEQCIASTSCDEEIQWIVAGGGGNGYTFNLSQLVIQNAKDHLSAKPDIVSNLTACLPFVKGSKVLIVEDDDFFGVDFISHMSGLLEDYPLAGLSPNQYYHMPTSTWVVYEMGWASPLTCTGFRVDEVMETFVQTLSLGIAEIDEFLWAHWGVTMDNPSIISHNAGLHVGLKDGTGYGRGHKQMPYPDADGSVLRRWIGPDKVELLKSLELL